MSQFRKAVLLELLKRN